MGKVLGFKSKAEREALKREAELAEVTSAVEVSDEDFETLEEMDDARVAKYVEGLRDFFSDEEIAKIKMELEAEAGV